MQTTIAKPPGPNVEQIVVYCTTTCIKFGILFGITYGVFWTLGQMIHSLDNWLLILDGLIIYGGIGFVFGLAYGLANSIALAAVVRGPWARRIHPRLLRNECGVICMALSVLVSMAVAPYLPLPSEIPAVLFMIGAMAMAIAWGTSGYFHNRYVEQSDQANANAH
jgi:hypothetical protein